MSADAHAAPNYKLYFGIFGALLVLTVVTVLVSYWHLPPGPAIALGLFIATVKASLVAAFFMHLKGEHKLIYYFLGLTVVFLCVLFLGPWTDSQFLSDRSEHVRVAEPVEKAAH